MGKSLRDKALDTVGDHRARWEELRTEGGVALEKCFDNTFEYVERALDGKTESKDFFKDGLALLVGYYTAGHGLYKAGYNACVSEPKAESKKKAAAKSKDVKDNI